jgi:hypothetical protein
MISPLGLQRCASSYQRATRCSAPPRRAASTAPHSDLRSSARAQLNLDVQEGALGLTTAPRSWPCCRAQPCTEVQHTSRESHASSLRLVKSCSAASDHLNDAPIVLIKGQESRFQAPAIAASRPKRRRLGRRSRRTPAEADLRPDGVIGTSIGGINSAIIAGNTREGRVAKLRESSSPFGVDGNLGPLLARGDAARGLAQQMSAITAAPLRAVID